MAENKLSYDDQIIIISLQDWLIKFLTLLELVHCVSAIPQHPLLKSVSNSFLVKVYNAIYTFIDCLELMHLKVNPLNIFAPSHLSY